MMMQRDGLASSESNGTSAVAQRQGESIPFPKPVITSDALCVTRTPAGHIQVLDWVCIIGHTFRQTFDPMRKTMMIETYHGQVIELDKEQTRHLINYLDKSACGESENVYYHRRSPRAFLDVPEVKALLSPVEPAPPTRATEAGEAKP
jgi:hypothetical protein